MIYNDYEHAIRYEFLIFAHFDVRKCFSVTESLEIAILQVKMHPPLVFDHIIYLSHILSSNVALLFCTFIVFYVRYVFL